MRKKHSRDTILKLYDEGLAIAAIAKKLGCWSSVVDYHICRNRVRNRKKIINWKDVQIYHDAGHKRKACLEKFGFSSSTWERARSDGRLIPRRHTAPTTEAIDTLCIKGRKYGNHHIKKRLIRDGILSERCYGENCSITKYWLGKPITLQLDHINGDSADNRIENLRLLCPN